MAYRPISRLGNNSPPNAEAGGAAETNDKDALVLLQSLLLFFAQYMRHVACVLENLNYPTTNTPQKAKSKQIKSSGVYKKYNGLIAHSKREARKCLD